MMRIVGITTVLVAPWQSCLGFVRPEIKATFMPHVSWETRLHAFEKDELDLANQGLKALLSPTGKGAAPTSSTSPAAATAAIPSNNAAGEATKQAVVEAVSKTPVMEKIPDNPVVAAAAEASPPPAIVEKSLPPAIPDLPSSVAPVKAAAVQQSETVLKIIPQKTAAVAESSSSSTYNDIVEAFRQAHMEKLPKVVATPPSSSAKAPTLSEFLPVKLKESFLTAADSWKSIQENGGAANGQVNVPKIEMNTMGEGYKDMAQQKLKIIVDPDTFSSIKQYFQSSGPKVKYMTIDELIDLFKLDLSGVEQFKATYAASLTNAGQQIDHAASSVATSYGTLAASLEALQATLRNNPDDFSKVFDAMNLKETAGWYVGATVSLMVLVGSAVAPAFEIKKKGRKIILTDAATPGLAPEIEVTKPETAVIQIEAIQADVEEKEAAKLEVAEQIQFLKNATEEVYEQLAALQEEKSLRAYEVATMKSELRTVVNRLDFTMSEEQHLRKSLEQTQKKLDDETSFLRAELEQRAATEEELREELAETKDRLAAETKRLKAAQKKAKSTAALAEVEKLENEKAELEKEMLSLRSEVAGLQKQLQQSAGSEPTAELQGKPNGSSSKAKTSSDKILSEAAALPASTASYSDMSERFFVAISEPAEPKQTTSAVRGAKAASRSTTGETATIKRTKKKKVSKKKMAVKKKKSAEKAKPPVTAIETAKTAAAAPDKTKTTVAADWASLSVSALKRKTVKELTSYLESMGLPTTDSAGKILKKDLLVENLMSASA